MQRRPLSAGVLPEPMFQIFVKENDKIRGIRHERPVGPRVPQSRVDEVLGPIMMQINLRICGGTEREAIKPWSSPEIQQVTFPQLSVPFTREERNNPLVGDYGYIPGVTPVPDSEPPLPPAGP